MQTAWIPPRDAAPIPWELIAESLRRPQRGLYPHFMYPLTAASPRRAAVAVVLWGDAEGARKLVLVQRGFGAPRHPGELAFPGGMEEAFDRDLPATARRELREELGVDTGLWELGCFPDCVAKGEIRFTPVFFRWEEPEPRFLPNPEIQEALLLPLRPLMQAPWELETFHTRGIELRIPRLELPVAPLWGATARVFKAWLDILQEVVEGQTTAVG